MRSGRSSDIWNHEITTIMYARHTTLETTGSRAAAGSPEEVERCRGSGSEAGRSRVIGTGCGLARALPKPRRKRGVQRHGSRGSTMRPEEVDIRCRGCRAVVDEPSHRTNNHTGMSDQSPTNHSLPDNSEETYTQLGSTRFQLTNPRGKKGVRKCVSNMIR